MDKNTQKEKSMIGSTIKQFNSKVINKKIGSLNSQGKKLTTTSSFTTKKFAIGDSTCKKPETTPSRSNHNYNYSVQFSNDPVTSADGSLVPSRKDTFVKSNPIKVKLAFKQSTKKKNFESLKENLQGTKAKNVLTKGSVAGVNQMFPNVRISKDPFSPAKSLNCSYYNNQPVDNIHNASVDYEIIDSSRRDNSYRLDHHYTYDPNKNNNSLGNLGNPYRNYNNISMQDSNRQQDLDQSRLSNMPYSVHGYDSLYDRKRENDEVIFQSHTPEIANSRKETEENIYNEEKEGSLPIGGDHMSSITNTFTAPQTFSPIRSSYNPGKYNSISIRHDYHKSRFHKERKMSYIPHNANPDKLSRNDNEKKIEWQVIQFSPTKAKKPIPTSNSNLTNIKLRYNEDHDNSMPELNKNNEFQNEISRETYSQKPLYSKTYCKEAKEKIYLNKFLSERTFYPQANFKGIDYDNVAKRVLEYQDLNSLCEEIYDVKTIGKILIRLNLSKIVKIQKAYKRHLYSTKSILKLQTFYRGYMVRMKFKVYLEWIYKLKQAHDLYLKLILPRVFGKIKEYSLSQTEISLAFKRAMRNSKIKSIFEYNKMTNISKALNKISNVLIKYNKSFLSSFFYLLYNRDLSINLQSVRKFLEIKTFESIVIRICPKRYIKLLLSFLRRWNKTAFKIKALIRISEYYERKNNRLLLLSLRWLNVKVSTVYKQFFKQNAKTVKIKVNYAVKKPALRRVSNNSKLTAQLSNDQEISISKIDSIDESIVTQSNLTTTSPLQNARSLVQNSPKRMVGHKRIKSNDNSIFTCRIADWEIVQGKFINHADIESIKEINAKLKLKSTGMIHLIPIGENNISDPDDCILNKVGKTSTLNYLNQDKGKLLRETFFFEINSEFSPMGSYYGETLNINRYKSNSIYDTSNFSKSKILDFKGRALNDSILIGLKSKVRSAFKKLHQITKLFRESLADSIVGLQNTIKIHHWRFIFCRLFNFYNTYGFLNYLDSKWNCYKKGWLKNKYFRKWKSRFSIPTSSNEEFYLKKLLNCFALFINRNMKARISHTVFSLLKYRRNLLYIITKFHHPLMKVRNTFKMWKLILNSKSLDNNTNSRSCQLLRSQKPKNISNTNTKTDKLVMILNNAELNQGEKKEFNKFKAAFKFSNLVFNAILSRQFNLKFILSRSLSKWYSLALTPTNTHNNLKSTSPVINKLVLHSLSFEERNSNIIDLKLSQKSPHSHIKWNTNRLTKKPSINTDNKSTRSMRIVKQNKLLRNKQYSKSNLLKLYRTKDFRWFCWNIQIRLLLRFMIMHSLVQRIKVHAMYYIFSGKLKKDVESIAFNTISNESDGENLDILGKNPSTDILFMQDDDVNYPDDLFFSYVLIIQQAWKIHKLQKYIKLYSVKLKRLSIVKIIMARTQKKILSQRTIKWNSETKSLKRMSAVKSIEKFYSSCKSHKTIRLKNKDDDNIINLIHSNAKYKVVSFLTGLGRHLRINQFLNLVKLHTLNNNSRKRFDSALKKVKLSRSCKSVENFNSLHNRYQFSISALDIIIGHPGNHTRTNSY